MDGTSPSAAAPAEIYNLTGYKEAKVAAAADIDCTYNWHPSDQAIMHLYEQLDAACEALQADKSERALDAVQWLIEEVRPWTYRRVVDGVACDSTGVPIDPQPRQVFSSAIPDHPRAEVVDLRRIRRVDDRQTQQ